MAKQEVKTQTTIEKEYVIPLKRAWLKVPEYKRTAKGVKAIKEFIAKHMRVPDRDLKKVKLDVYLNNELWFKGGKKPPSKVKVKAVKEGDIVRVELADFPEYVKFLKAKHDKLHEKPEKKKEEKVEEKKEGLEEKMDEEKPEEEKEEKQKEEEKAKSVEQVHIKDMEKAAKAHKHTMKGKGPQVQRKALKK